MSPTLTRENPFIPIPDFVRVGFIVFILLSRVVFPLFSYYLYGEMLPNTFARLFFEICYSLVIVSPFIFYNKKRFGLFHPVIFIPLFDVAKSSMKRVSSLIDSMFSISPNYGEIYNTVLNTYDQDMLSEYDLYLKILTTVYIAVQYLSFYTLPSINTFRIYDNRNFNEIKSKLIWMVLLGVLIGFVFLMARGGVTAHFSSFGKNRIEEMKGLGIVVVLMRICSIACMIWVCFDENVLKNKIFWLIVLISVALVFVSTGSRSSILTTILMLMLIWTLKTKQLPNLKYIVVLPIVAFFIVSILGQVRNSTFRGKTVDWSYLTKVDVSSSYEHFNEEIVSRNSVKTSDLPILVKGIEQEGLLLGESYFSAIFFFVPRVLWPNKPTPIGFIAGTRLMGSRGGVPPSTTMEAYWNFHVFGVVLVAFLHGYFFKYMESFYLRNHTQNASYVLYAMMLLNLEPNSLVMIAFFQSFFTVLIIYYLLNLIRQKKELLNLKIIDTKN